MPDATRSTQSLERLRDHAIAALVPFFLDGETGDENDARLAAEGLVNDYHATTPRELQLSTQIIALSWASLACLRTAVAATNLSIDDKVVLQESAIALDRSSQKATKLLDAGRKERSKHPAGVNAVETRWDEGAFQGAINLALEKLNDANAKWAAFLATQPAEIAAGNTVTPIPETLKLPFVLAEPMTASVLAYLAKSRPADH